MSDCIHHDQKEVRAGYARFRYGGSMQLAHRVAYCIANGMAIQQIAGLVVRHKCDNTRCVNPAHLEIGTQLENIHDAQIRGRAAHARKLTHEQVLEIRRTCVPGTRQMPTKAPTGYASLAKKFGVTAWLVKQVHLGRTYREVQL